MSHDYHESLPGYHEGQLLVDGCRECEERGRDIRLGLDHMDAERFARAWERAHIFNRGETEGQLAGQISDAERPLLDVLWAIIIQLECRGVPTDSPAPSGRPYLALQDVSRPNVAIFTPHQITVLQLAIKGLDAIVDRDGWLQIMKLAWPDREIDAQEGLALGEAFAELRTAVGG